MSTLAGFLAQHFCNFGWTWSLKGKGNIVPTESDIQAALDEAQRVMYSEPVGAILEVGRLVIIKQNTGYDIYVLAGTINPIGEE